MSFAKQEGSKSCFRHEGQGGAFLLPESFAGLVQPGFSALLLCLASQLQVVAATPDMLAAAFEPAVGVRDTQGA